MPSSFAAMSCERTVPGQDPDASGRSPVLHPRIRMKSGFVSGQDPDIASVNPSNSALAGSICVVIECSATASKLHFDPHGAYAPLTYFHKGEPNELHSFRFRVRWKDAPDRIHAFR